MVDVKQIALRIAAETRLDPRTVRRWVRDPGSVHESCAWACEVAAESLGLAGDVRLVRSEDRATGAGP